MPCYGNTIIKISQVRQSIRDNISSIIIWAIGIYPVEQEDNDIELVMFIPIDSDERDPDSQAVFKKNEYYIIGKKVIPEYYHGAKRLK
ncbi:26789_t:CDS:1, partial [Racocetra persica]